MSEVIFDGDNQDAPRRGGSVFYGSFKRSSQPPAMVLWLMRRGVKSEQMANFILLGIVVVLIIASIFIYRMTITSPNEQSNSQKGFFLKVPPSSQ